MEMVILLEPRMSRRRAPLSNVLPEYVTKCCCTEEDKDDGETDGDDTAGGMRVYHTERLLEREIIIK